MRKYVFVNVNATPFIFEKMVDDDFVVIMIIGGHIFLCCDYVGVHLPLLKTFSYNQIMIC